MFQSYACSIISFSFIVLKMSPTQNYGLASYIFIPQRDCRFFISDPFSIVCAIKFSFISHIQEKLTWYYFDLFMIVLSINSLMQNKRLIKLQLTLVFMTFVWSREWFSNIELIIINCNACSFAVQLESHSRKLKIAISIYVKRVLSA
jgi:hypothetical protein